MGGEGYGDDGSRAVLGTGRRIPRRPDPGASMRLPSALLAAPFVCSLAAVSGPARAGEAPAPSSTPAPGPATAAEDYPAFITLDEAQGMDLRPYGYRRVRRPAKGLIVSGSVVFGATWLTTTFAGSVAADNEEDQAGLFTLVPVVGPLLWLATDGGNHATDYLLVLSTAAQGAGVTLLWLGVKGSDRWERLPAFMLSPAVVPGGAAVQATGSF